MARNATPSASMSAVSSFRKKQSAPVRKGSFQPESKTDPCPSCGKPYTAHTNKGPTGHGTPKPIQNTSNVDTRVTVQTTNKRLQHQIGVINAAPRQILSKAELKKHRQFGHPRVDLYITRRYKNSPQAAIKGVADSGAMSNLWGLHQYLASGFSKADLKSVSMDVRAANRNSINIVGAFEAVIQGYSPIGETISSSCLVYISDSVNDFFLSCDTMLDLGIIDKAFPTIGSCMNNVCTPNVYNDPNVCHVVNIPTAQPVQTQHKRSINSGCLDAADGQFGCKCPQRESVPLRPKTLPFEPTPENNERMRTCTWLLDHYSKSTFNTCPHRPLPCMTGPSIENSCLRPDWSKKGIGYFLLQKHCNCESSIEMEGTSIGIKLPFLYIHVKFQHPSK